MILLIILVGGGGYELYLASETLWCLLGLLGLLLLASRSYLLLLVRVSGENPSKGFGLGLVGDQRRASQHP